MTLLGKIKRGMTLETVFVARDVNTSQERQRNGQKNKETKHNGPYTRIKEEKKLHKMPLSTG